MHKYRRNRIEVLENLVGERCEEEGEIANILIEFYTNLFSSSTLDQIEEALEAIPLELAMKQMDPLKAPGPDGMPPLFFQQFWPTVGEDVIEAVLTCLNSGTIPPSINRTFITLIPKVKSLVKVSEFRPIALCNTLYKILSKVLANRLKKILPCVISESQTTF